MNYKRLFKAIGIFILIASLIILIVFGIIQFFKYMVIYPEVIGCIIISIGIIFSIRAIYKDLSN